MANVIPSLIAVGLIMGSVLLLASTALSSADRVSLARERMVQRDMEREGTGLTLIGADLMPTSTDNLVTVGSPNGATVAAPFSR